MLTIFTTAKPFRGHASVIQRNALESWTRLHPEVEVILFGQDEGAAEVCRDLGIRHEPQVEKNEFGTKRLDSFFDRAQEIAAYPVVCYINSDIILLDDFARAIERLRGLVDPFLMVGRRWDTDFTQPIDFTTDKWRETVRNAALRANNQRPSQWIDYFAFSRGLFHRKIPQFVIGRVHWDNWLIWGARNLGAKVIDASPVIMSVHQNHDYSYHPKGKDGVWSDIQSQRNFELAGGYSHLRTIANATHRLTCSGLRPNRLPELPYWRAVATRNITIVVNRVVIALQNKIWHPFLNLTRPIRASIGLRGKLWRRKPKYWLD